MAIGILELSSQQLYILAKKRLARITRLSVAHEDKFGKQDEYLVATTRRSLHHGMKEASFYLSHTLGRSDEVTEIKRKVEERYYRR